MLDMTPFSDSASEFVQNRIRKTSEGLEMTFGTQVRIELMDNHDLAWLSMKPSPRPCFNPALFRELNAAQQFFMESQGRALLLGNEYSFNYIIFASDIPGIFNLGGDLDLMVDLIVKQDRRGLLEYAHLGLHGMYFNLTQEHYQAIVALIQGDCFGGGFESVLCCDILIAEKSARFCFPEIVFNLFPGLGAYSILARKVGPRLAHEMIATGARYSAEDLFKLGIVDKVVEDGQGKAAVVAYLKSRSGTANGLRGLTAAVRRVHGLDYSELADILTIWVDTALRLTPRELNLMKLLVAGQTARKTAD